jgi:SNF2 family DNA or RNA helicase
MVLWPALRNCDILVQDVNTWRIDQTKPVSICRLITAGTIEEKTYKYATDSGSKQHLSQKVHNNLEQHWFFQVESLRGLF